MNGFALHRELKVPLGSKGVTPSWASSRLTRLRQAGFRPQAAPYSNYLMGFFTGVKEFADQIHPDGPYAWHP